MPSGVMQKLFGLYGLVEPTRSPLDNYITSDSCWLWQGTTRGGYAILFTLAGVSSSVHIRQYERKYGPVPIGKELHHTCFVRRCINPDHVIPVTRKKHSALHH